MDSGGSLGSKEPPFYSLNNRKMGVVWLKVGVFQGKLMKRTPLVRYQCITALNNSGH